MCWLCDVKTPAAGPRAAARARGPWAPRRAFLLAAGSAAAAPALAQVSVGRASGMRNLIPAQALEDAAQKQYSQVLAEARQQRALAPASHPQLQRLRRIADRLIPQAMPWNERARGWQWEVNLIGSKDINAWCMPGGKIAFYTGILDQRLNLSDDEVGMIMGHEMAHALREHAREQLAKTQATGVGLSTLSSIFGLGQLGDLAANIGTQLISLRFSRADESDADLVGLEVAARGAFNPQAAVSLWRKMMAQSGSGGGGALNFLSTHPSGPERIRALQDNVPRVEGLYAQAQHNGPVPSSVSGANAGSAAGQPAARSRVPMPNSPGGNTGTPVDPAASTNRPRYDQPIGRPL